MTAQSLAFAEESVPGRLLGWFRSLLLGEALVGGGFAVLEFVRQTLDRLMPQSLAGNFQHVWDQLLPYYLGAAGAALALGLVTAGALLLLARPGRMPEQDGLPHEAQPAWFQLLLMLDAFACGSVMALELVRQLLNATLQRSLPAGQADILNLWARVAPYYPGNVLALLALVLVTVGAFLVLAVAGPGARRDVQGRLR